MWDVAVLSVVRMSLFPLSLLPDRAYSFAIDLALRTAARIQALLLVLVENRLRYSDAVCLRRVRGNGFRGYWIAPGGAREAGTSGVRGAPAGAVGAREAGGAGSAGDPGVCLLVMHGGGFAAGHALQSLWALCRIRRLLQRRLPEGSKVEIFSLDYDLSTVSKYPRQSVQANAAYEHLLASFHPHRILIMGDSAGGNAALSLCHAVAARAQRLRGARQRGSALPAGALLVSPWLDLRCAAPSFERNRGRDILTAEIARHWADCYVGGRALKTDVGVSPGLAEPQRLSSLSLYVTGGKHEVLFDDLLDFELRFRDANSAGRQAWTVFDWRADECHDQMLLGYHFGLRSAAAAMERIAIVAEAMLKTAAEAPAKEHTVLNVGHATPQELRRVLDAILKRN